MKATELIGKKVTRRAPACCSYGNDSSYMGDVMTILNATDYLISVYREGGVLQGVSRLHGAFCDDNWVCVEEFLKNEEEMLEKIKQS